MRRDLFLYLFILSVFISIMMKYDENLNVLRHHTTSPSSLSVHTVGIRFVCFLRLMRIKIAFENLLLSEISSKVYKSKFKSHFVTWLLLSNDLCVCMMVFDYSASCSSLNVKQKSHLKIIKMKKRRRKFYFLIFEMWFKFWIKKMRKSFFSSHSFDTPAKKSTNTCHQINQLLLPCLTVFSYYLFKCGISYTWRAIADWLA